MPVLNFPANPASQTPPNVYSPTSSPASTSNSVTYIWDGVKWESAGAAASAITQVSGKSPITVDNSDPANPIVGADDYVYTGGVPQTLPERLEQYVSVLDYGADPTGADDSASAIENALNSNPQKKVFFPKGTYRVTRTLSIINTTYAMVGERTERAQNGPSTGFNNAVTIDFEGAAGSWIVDKVVTGSATATVGPYVHENINFETGDANGFRFGDESITVSDTGSGADSQAYNFGVIFKQCNLQGATAFQSEDASDGRVTRLGTTAVNLVKGFESVFEDVSFKNFGTGLRFYGCDKPVIDRVRGQAEVCIDCIGSGSFTVQNVIENFQSEGWKFCAIRNDNVGMAVNNLRLEGNKGQSGTAPVNGMGVFVLPQVTDPVRASVNGGSLQVVFPTGMNDIIIPGLSLLELETETGDVYRVMADTVQGRNVYVSGGYFRFIEYLQFVQVRRIHGYGVLHYQSSFGTEVTNASVNVYNNCPAFVYKSSRSSMHITNATTESGNSGNNACVALGNMPGETFYMNPQLCLTSCSALLTPEEPNPYIVSTNFADANGDPGNSNNSKRPTGDIYNELRTVRRQWVYTPHTMGLTRNNQNKVTWRKLDGDANTDQSSWAWVLEPTITEANVLRITDETLPSVNIGYIGIEIRVRAKSGNSTTISVNAEGNGGGNILNAEPITELGGIVTIKRRRPTQWFGPRTTDTGLKITTSGTAYITGVVITQYYPTDNTYLMSPDSTVFNITVANDGTLSATPV